MRPSDPIRTIALVLGVSAALVLIATLSRTWVTASAGPAEVYVGPIGVETCYAARCSPMGKDLDADIEILMLIGAVSGLASAAGAGWYAGAYLLARRDRLPPAKLVQIALGVAAGSFVLFVVRTLSELGHGASPGWAMFPGIGGVIVAAVYLRKLVPHMGPAATAPLPWQQAGAATAGWGHAHEGATHASAPHASAPYAGPSHAGAPYAGPSHAGAPYAGPSHVGAPNAGPARAGPPAPGYAPSTGPTPATPACPRCGQPLQFVAAYQRWFCAREQQYVG